MLIALFVLSATSDLLSGMRDASNFVSTVISTRALPPRLALGLSALAVLAGPFIFGVAVAHTFGHDLIDPAVVTLAMLLAAVASALIWNVVTLFLKFPASSSHALFGGLVGAVLVSPGLGGLRMAGIDKILISLFLSPLFGLAAGYLLTRLIYVIARSASPRINGFFRRAQVVTGAALALSYGANDVQRTMGVLGLALVVSGALAEFSVPAWVVVLCAGMTALGIGVGGWGLIRTLGGGFYRIRPVHGFSAQAAAAGVILTAALVGGPVSSSQVATSAILGAGSADRVNKVRWELATQILTAWLLTIPACALLAAGFHLLLLHAAP